MKKDIESTGNEKTNRVKKKMTISIVILTLLVVATIYIMILFPRNFIVIGICGIVLLVLVYRIINQFFQVQEEIETRREREFESLFKSEKASYILLRKNFEELSEKIDNVKNDSQLPIEELISAQKSIAKVTINRSKEHSMALMNSNDKLKDHIFEMDEKINDIQSAVKENEKYIGDIISREVVSKNEELISKMSEMEQSINSEIKNSIGSIDISSMVQSLNIPKQSDANEESNTVDDDFKKEELPNIQVLDETTQTPEKFFEPEKPKEESEIPEIEMPEKEEEEQETDYEIPKIEMPEDDSPEMEQMGNSRTFEPRVEPLTEESDVQNLDELEEKVKELQKQAANEQPELSSLEINREEPDLIVPIEDISAAEEIDLKMTPDEIQQLINDKESKETEEEEEFIPNIDFSGASEEIPSMQEIEKMLASIPVPETDIDSIPEPDAKDQEPQKDANHVMTPDEISALIGEVPESKPEPQPEPAAAPVENDSSHVMTPDEIAALLASI